jgi:hypothetical protein
MSTPPVRALAWHALSVDNVEEQSETSWLSFGGRILFVRKVDGLKMMPVRPVALCVNAASQVDSTDGFLMDLDSENVFPLDLMILAVANQPEKKFGIEGDVDDRRLALRPGPTSADSEGIPSGPHTYIKAFPQAESTRLKFDLGSHNRDKATLDHQGNPKPASPAGFRPAL